MRGFQSEEMALHMVHDEKLKVGWARSGRTPRCRVWIDGGTCSESRVCPMMTQGDRVRVCHP